MLSILVGCAIIMGMNRKIIIIITVLICLIAAIITAQHFANKDTENTTAPTMLTETPQADAPSESETEERSTDESAPSQSDKKENASQTANKAQDTTTTTKPTTEAEKQTITVTISISCEKAIEYGKGDPSGYFLVPFEYTAKQGDTAFDVLEAVAKENGITLKYQNKSYIQAINGLAERDCGGASGWTYRINGEKPNKAATKYELADGDSIEWYYALSPGD